MACLEIRSASGELTMIPENTPYPAGFSFTGKIDWNCAGMVQKSGGSSLVDEELSRAGIKWGDAIAWTTKKLGIKQCAPCKARQEILNHAAQYGWTETLRQLKETF